MKWYTYELSKGESEIFKSFLRDNRIIFEPCQCYDGAMVSVFCDEETMNRCNLWLLRKRVNKMKWHICELSKDESEMFKSFLRDNGIKFDSCQCYNGVMVSVFCDEAMMNICNSFIDTLVTMEWPFMLTNGKQFS